MARNWNEEFDKKHKDELERLDFFLENWDPDQSELAARIILQVLKAVPAHPFARDYRVRAEKWQENYHIDVARGKPSHTLGNELVHLLFCREAKMADDLLDRERKRKVGKLVPSVRYRTPQEQITDSEVKEFMEMVDEYGFWQIFDPASIIACNILVTMPFAIVEKTRFTFGELAEKYTTGQVARPWDRVKRDPLDGMIFDWVLFAARQEMKWTWVICDRWFRRLPFSHPLKSVGGQRPGWKWSTSVMKDTGLMTQRQRRTWRLTVDGRRVVDEMIIPLWLA